MTSSMFSKIPKGPITKNVLRVSKKNTPVGNVIIRF